MDGPNVNCKALEKLQQDRAEEFGSKLIVVGSCGLHTLHNSFKGGFTIWQLDKSLLKRFIKSEVLRNITPLQLINLDSTDKAARVPLKNVDIGLGAETVRLNRSPSLYSNRCNVFLHGHMSKPYPELWDFCEKLLLLSHGQATVERGFSVNKEVEADNMQEDAIVAQRLICDYIFVCGGVLNVPLTKELLGAAASARSHYRLYLEAERRKQESQAQKQKRKAVEDHIEELRKKTVVLTEVATSLENEADKCAEAAEGKSGTLMAQLITKSNVLRKRYKEKIAELKGVESELEAESAKLRKMS
ncbi:hypothetical protein ACEWY4_021445 [Coilia grayii]|uniref:Uncharacterized protein n=1 Tax=Coilia grayii TaxID=363190 RepID=A0ABD1J934_9TELE